MPCLHPLCISENIARSHKFEDCLRRKQDELQLVAQVAGEYLFNATTCTNPYFISHDLSLSHDEHRCQNPGGAKFYSRDEVVHEMPRDLDVSMPGGRPPLHSLPRDRSVKAFRDWLRMQPNNGGLVQGSMLPRKVWPLGPSGEELADLHALASAAGLLTRGAKKGEAGGVFLCIPGMESSAGAVQLKGPDTGLVAHEPLPPVPFNPLRTRTRRSTASAPVNSPHSLQSFIAHVHSLASGNGICHGALLPRKMWPSKAFGHPYVSLRELAHDAGFEVEMYSNLSKLVVRPGAVVILV